MNGKDERAILAKMYVIPSMIKALMISELVSAGALLILLMIQRFIFKDININYYGLLAYGAIAVACLIMIMLMYGNLQKLSKQDAWLCLISKALDVIKDGEYSQSMIYDQGALIVGKFIALKDKGHFVSRNGFFSNISDRKAEASLLALLLDEELPNAKRYFLPIMLIPLALLLVCFIPTYVQSYSKLQEQEKMISASLTNISGIFETTCDYVYSDDPDDDYYSYYVNGYLEDDDHYDYAYVTVSVNKAGMVDGVSYSIDIDVNKSKEENLQSAEKTISLFNSLIKAIDVPAVNENLLKDHELSDEFTNWFLTSSYYENEDFVTDDEMMISYYSTPLEEYDDYGLSYIYMSIYEFYYD